MPVAAVPEPSADWQGFEVTWWKVTVGREWVVRE